MEPLGIPLNFETAACALGAEWGNALAAVVSPPVDKLRISFAAAESHCHCAVELGQRQRRARAIPEYRNQRGQRPLTMAMAVLGAICHGALLARCSHWGVAQLSVSCSR